MIIRAKAPLRVSFCGGGTDIGEYFVENGGMVLSSTIDMYAYATIIPNDGNEIEVHSLDYNIVEKYNCDEDLYNCKGSLNLVKATLHAMNVNKGCKVFLHNDAPPGSGLGSSSALVVALIAAVAEWKDEHLGKYEIAELAYRIEREDLKISGGYQDQYSSAFGGFNYIEFGKNSIVVNPLKIDMNIVNELEYNTILCYTGGIRLSANIIDDQVENYKRGQNDTVNAMSELKELTVEIKEALLKGSLDSFGALLNKAWLNKKKMSSRISNKKIDEIYEAAIRNGALGGKLLGAGGGGYMLIYCSNENRYLLSDMLEELGCKVIVWHFEMQGVQSWRVKGK